MSLNRTRLRYSGAEDVDFSFYGGFPIDFPTGIGGMDCTIGTVRCADGIGTEIQLTTVPERLISISGYVTGIPGKEYRRMLERAFAPTSAGRLWAETEAHERFYLDCISSSAPTIQGARQRPRFQVNLTAAYPYWQRDAEREIRLDAADGAEDFDAVIVSDVPVPYRLAISSAAGCQSAAISIGARELRYTGAIPAGKTLAIAIAPNGRICADLDGTDVIGRVSGALRKLEPGAQRIHLDIPAGSGITAKIIYREGRAGV